MSASAIYQGSVRHRRYEVTGHSFQYPLALAYIDLDELPELLGGRLVAARPGIVRFRRSDYLGDPSTGLAESVRRLVAERSGKRPDGPIRLLTNLRSFGHCFNPVSFYYCFAPGADDLEAIVAEVTNTPWGERHAYVLRRDQHAAAGTPLRGSSAKALHVSPFMGMEQRYEWRVARPADTLSVHIESHRSDGLAFDATLSMRRRPLTSRTLANVTARYPLASARVLALIYAHALRLKVKGVPIHAHPKPGVT
ncbi:MAG: DUF1365 domain-containing protein [Thermoleophilaceae bacterium]